MAETSKRCPAVHYPPRLIPQLPDEISIQCIARVPRLLHPTLALVSRSWRSLLNSSLLFSVRSDLGVSRRFICFSVKLPGDQSQWYLLDPDPQNPRHILRLPPPPIPIACYSCAVLGPIIFVIGGCMNRIEQPTVQIFDACLNQWSMGPPMAVTRMYAIVRVIGGRIYVFSRYDIPPSDSWAEVLEPGLGVWTPVPSPTHVHKNLVYAAAVLGGKLHMVTSKEGGVVFDPEGEPPWSAMPTTKGFGWLLSLVVVDGVMYTLNHMRDIKGYDQTADMWMPVEGLGWEMTNMSALANVGGLLCIIWEKRSREGVNMMELMMTGIKVSRKSCGALWGLFVWTKSVVLVENGLSVAHSLELEL